MSDIVDLEFEMIYLTLSLYDNPSLPRNIVQIFVDHIINFVNVKFRAYMKQQLNVSLKRLDANTSHQIQSIFDACKTILEKFSTECRRFFLYQEKGYLMQPIEHEIGTRFVNENVDNMSVAEREKVFVQYIPLKWSLKVLLEIPGMFQLLKDYMYDLQMEQNIISNFIQGNLWKEVSKNFGEGKFVIPLFAYYDEFETGNALGSHAGVQKLGALYTQIPCFPPYISSKLSNIMLTSLLYGKDRKLFENKVFQKFINELNELNVDGLLLNVDNEEIKVYSQLGLITGDNLGLNEMLGYVDNFNSGRPYRICRATITEI